MPCLPRPGELLSEQRLATGVGNMKAPARRPGRRADLEHGLDGGGDELRGLRVDDDVPAEQHAADDLPGMRGRVVRADRGGLGHTRTVEETVPAGLIDTPGLQHVFQRPPGRDRSTRRTKVDHVENRSIPDTTRLTPHLVCLAVRDTLRT